MTDSTAARATLLQELSIEVSNAADPRAVAAAVVRLGRALLDAASGVIWVADSEGALDLLASDGVPERFLEQWRRLLPDEDIPAMHAVRAGVPLWVGSFDEYRGVTPTIAHRARDANRPMAFAALPLAVEGRNLGVIVFGFPAPHTFGDDERRLALALAGHAAQALDRGRLQAAQARALAGLRVIAKVGEMLSASLDVDATLSTLARSVVPDVADWCAIDMFVDGNIRRLIAHHGDPAKIAIASEYAERYPERLDSPSGSLARILTTGEPIYVRRITRDMLNQSIADVDQRALLHSLGLRSIVQAPLVSEGHVRGAVSFIMSESGREYDETDRDLLVEIGRRAGLALTNAALYAREQRARDRITRLSTVNAALARAPATADVGEVACREGAAALHASTAALYVVDGDRLRLVAHHNYAADLVARHTEIPLDTDNPVTRAVRTKEAVVIETTGFMCKPLADGRGEVVGVLAFGFAGPRAFTEDERAFARTLADHCAQAFERARILDLERRARDRAAEANRMKDDFLATVSHELRTPLNAILGWAHLLDAERMGDMGFMRRGLDVIRRNAHAQREIIDDILDVSRIITGKLRIGAEPVDLANVARDALEVVRPAADAKGVHLVSSGLDQVTRLVGDAARLQQVFWNLLANAVKFTPSGGTVRIELVASPGQVMVRVCDDGIGIAPDILPFVFDRFRQEDSSSTRAQGGLGLGLSIVRHLVELHGGTVSVSSEGRGKGATFEVVLPTGGRLASPAPPTPPSTRALEPTTSSSLDGVKLLVVDDDRDSRELIAVILRDAGAHVSVTADAAEAVAAFERGTFDLVVSDIAMPTVDGFALFGMLQKIANERSRPFLAVALTAYDRQEDRTAVTRAGFAAHVAKPVEPSILVDVTARVVRASRG